MALLVLLICLGLQRYLQLYHYGYQIHRLQKYYQWLMNKFTVINQTPGFIGVLILLLPILIICSAIYVFSYHLYGQGAEFVFSLILVWICIDARDLNKDPYLVQDAATVFLCTYERLFAVIFWFIVFLHLGIMPALILYPMLVSLRDYLQIRAPEAGFSQLYTWTRWTLGVLDWLPIRLTGLSFALVGHFSQVFPSWQQQLTLRIRQDQQLIVQWGRAAIDTNPQEFHNNEQYPMEYRQAIQLVDRVLVLWLAIIAIFTLGIVVGKVAILNAI